MTTDDFTEAARAEADRQYPQPGILAHNAFEIGAVWARDHLAAQEVSEEEAFQGALAILAYDQELDLANKDDLDVVLHLWGKQDPDERNSRFAESRAALSAARAALTAARTA